MQKVKKYFDVKIETTVPAILTFKVLAETPEEALKLIKNKTPNAVQYKLAQRKDIKAMIYDTGTTLIRLVKRLIHK